ncbi:MAG: cytidylate kinase family protein [Candidatus Woesearchaeota archaeon]
MIITISGEPGAGKSTVAKILAKKLGLKYFSIGSFLRELALKNNKGIVEINKLAEENLEIDKYLDSKLIEISKKDNYVVDSRIAFYFIPKSIKVFLKCDEEVAAKRILKEINNVENKRISENYKNLNEVIQSIRTRKKSELKRYKKTYGIIYNDLKNYDLVIDTTKLTPEKTTRIIILFLKSVDKKPNF